MSRDAKDGKVRHGNGWRIAVWGTAGLALLLPWVAMRFTSEVSWGPADFIIFGAMLLAACGTYELATRMTGNSTYRAAVGVAVAAAFLLIWISLAVGIIGTEGNPANLIFAGVLVVGIVGALISRFRPSGMARALVATALAQASVAVIALFTAWGKEAVMLPMFFVALWFTSAWLFRKAAREQTSAHAAS